MATSISALGLWLIISCVAAAVIVLLIFSIRRSQNKKERSLREAFGKIPVRSDSDDGIEQISAYHVYRAAAGGGDLLIDETTWDDLNMDDVFDRINACASSVGEEYLYHMLHDLAHSEQILARRENMIAWFSAHERERIAVQKILTGIGKRRNNGLSYYIFNAAAKKMRYAWVFSVMAMLPVAGFIMMPFFLVPGIVLAAASACINAAAYYFTNLRLESEMESMAYFSALLHGGKVLNKKMKTSLSTWGVDLQKALGPFRKKGGMLSGSTKQAVAELEFLVVSMKAIFLIDLIRYNRTINVLAQNVQELHALFEIVGEIDTAIAAASFRASLPHCCTPVFHAEKSIWFTDMYHPLLRAPVANSGKIDNDSIITGSNASGKSTFIKGLAVNNILAQTIHTCCARRYALAFSYVVTSMARRDDIISGDSYFVAEIKSLKRVVEYVKNQYCTCFIDEILRGTNTHERIAASTAVMKLLHDEDSLCVVASHDIELTELLRDIYDNYHFCERLDDHAIVFDYLLKDGPSQTTNAIKLLKYMGIDERISDEAQRLLEER